MFIRMCEACHNKVATQIHHKFSQSKLNRKLYGKGNKVDHINWIDDKRNIQHTCADCNVSHAGHGKGLVVLTEQEFCEMMKIKPRSKTARIKHYANS